MTPTRDTWAGYDSFWPRAENPPPAEGAGGADAYAEFAAAADR